MHAITSTAAQPVAGHERMHGRRARERQTAQRAALCPATRPAVFGRVERPGQGHQHQRGGKRACREVGVHQDQRRAGDGQGEPACEQCHRTHTAMRAGGDARGHRPAGVERGRDAEKVQRKQHPGERHMRPAHEPGHQRREEREAQMLRDEIRPEREQPGPQELFDTRDIDARRPPHRGGSRPPRRQKRSAPAPPMPRRAAGFAKMPCLDYALRRSGAGHAAAGRLNLAEHVSHTSTVSRNAHPGAGGHPLRHHAAQPGHRAAAEDRVWRVRPAACVRARQAAAQGSPGHRAGAAASLDRGAARGCCVGRSGGRRLPELQARPRRRRDPHRTG